MSDNFTMFSGTSGSGIVPDDFHCGLPPFLPSFLNIPNAVNIVQGLIAAIAFLIGLPMNIYLLIIIIKYPSLHERSFFLSLQIIIAEIAYYVIVIPTILASSITGTWIFGEVVCNMTGMMHDAFALFRFSMMFVLTVDRFISIFGPFFYCRHGGKIAALLSMIMWLLTLVRIVTPLYGVLDCYNYIPTFKTCTVFSGCSDSCEIFAGVSIAFIVFTGVILPSSLYAIIFIKVRKLFSASYNLNISSRMSEDKSESVTATEISRNQRKKKIITTMFFLLLSLIGGTTPAFVLYIISLFYRQPNFVIFVVNMLVGRTFFNLIPVFDVIAFSRNGDIREISLELFTVLKIKIQSLRMYLK